jgi:hypothetical protein
MQVIFKGEQSCEEVLDNLLSIVRMFKERYGIEDFRELQLSMTLMDKQGDDVELVDSRTSEVFRVFEVHKTGEGIRPVQQPTQLKLVVDNTIKS